MNTGLKVPEVLAPAPLPAALPFPVPALDSGAPAAVGRTPLVPLRRVAGADRLRVYAKLEAMNPGGSSKDRPALQIIRRGIESGAIGPGTVVVESSSGNMGIGLAQVCRYLGLRFVCVVDPRTTGQHIAIVKAYGGEVDVVPAPDPETGEYLPARIRRVRELVDSFPSAFWPDQFGNEANSEAHREGTIREIVEELSGRVDYVFCATSTCGTLRGCSEHLRRLALGTCVVAVDALGSVIFGGPKAERPIPGLGSGMMPGLLRPGMCDRQVHVTGVDCVAGCRRLMAREALLVGGSAGGVFTAYERMQEDLPDGSTCVLIFCDRGERYLDTIFSDEWVERLFGDVSHLWSDEAEIPSAWP